MRDNNKSQTIDMFYTKYKLEATYPNMYAKKKMSHLNFIMNEIIQNMTNLSSPVQPILNCA